MQPTKLHHMASAKILLLLLGGWPLQTTGWKMQFYQFYTKFALIYCITFNLSEYIEAVKLLLEKSVDIEENLGVAIPFSLCLFKLIIIKSKKMKNCILETISWEKQVFERNDPDLIEISMSYSNICKKIFLVQMTFGFVATIFYIVSPLVNILMGNLEYNNVTGIYEKDPIFSSWVPFDDQKYYAGAYMFQLGGTIYASLLFTGTLGFMFSLLMFVVGQIKILQWKLRNFSQCSKDLASESNLTEKDAQFVFLHQCILEHQNIIRMTTVIRDSFQMYYLIDFLVVAFQLTLIALQILSLPRIDFRSMGLIMHVVNLYVQLILVYKPADDIFEQSMAVSKAIFDSDWYTYPLGIQKRMHFMMARSHKHLHMSIGSLYQVRIYLIAQISKTFYSLICFTLKKM